MKIGACGIACEVCGLHTKGICGGCGPGTDESSKVKLEKMKEMGVECQILGCAVKNKIEFCSRDCNKFPCEIYVKGNFPYSQVYIDMYKQRNK